MQDFADILVAQDGEGHVDAVFCFVCCPRVERCEVPGSQASVVVTASGSVCGEEGREKSSGGRDDLAKMARTLHKKGR